jgi:GTP-binding protein
MNWLGENQVPFAIVFTKADKQSKSRTESNIKIYLEKLKEQWEELPPHFVTSSLSGIGKIEMLAYIDSINSSLKKN